MGLGYTDISGRYHYGNGDYYDFNGHVNYRWGGGTPWQGWTFKDFIPGLRVDPGTNNDDSFINSLNSTGSQGYYIIDSATNYDSWSSSLFRKLRITSYFDSESNQTFNTKSIIGGSSGLGSESSTIENDAGETITFDHKTEFDFLT